MKKNILHSLFFVFLFVLISCEKGPVKVACIGDSITEGARITWQSRDAYPVVLDSILGDNYAVLNCGRSAATMLKSGNLPYWRCNEFSNVFVYNPDIAIIKLGTNDTKPRNWNAEKFAEDYQSMIDTLRTMKSAPEIYLCLPVPVVQDWHDINDSTLVHGVIPAIKELALTNNLPVIDLYSEMKGYSQHFPDFVHPNEKGAEIMAHIIAEEMNH